MEIEPPASRTASPAPAPPESAELDRLLDAAGDYVSRYADVFSNLAAQEHRRQWWQDGDRTVTRTSVAEMVFVRLPGSLPWGTFRDVFERNGQAIRPQDRRLEALFARPRADAVEQANAILLESAQDNLGPVYRTANLPTLALLFLLPENRSRFAFERKGQRRFDGVIGIEVRFEEVGTPTLVRDRSRNDTPARGRFWIDPVRGTVLRSEAGYFLEEEERAHVATEYRREPEIEIFVPAEMYELYPLPGGGKIDARSRYSKYRRFTVSVEEEVAR